MRVRELLSHGIPAEVVELIERRNIHTLTPVQQKAIEAGVLRGESVVVSAPTSAGKTLIGELVAVSHAGSGGITVFLVSHKALARQIYDLMTTLYTDESHTPFLKAGILTGDVDTVHGAWSRFDFVVSTYERLYATPPYGG